VAIVGAFDVHRAQLTYDYVSTETGEVQRGQIRPADRQHLRAWLARFEGETQVVFAVEACTGWRYVVEELKRVGCEVHLAEPADLSRDKGSKQRAKTDAADARHLRELLVQDRVPESWIPPAEVLEARGLMRLYMDLTEERAGWRQRISATLFHQGAGKLESVLDASGRSLLLDVGLSPVGRQAVEVGLRQVARLSAEQALPGHLSRQGPPLLRWALFEAALQASRAASPDHAYYESVKARRQGDAKIAALAVARKLARRCYHTLRELGPEAWPAAA